MASGGSPREGAAAHNVVHDDENWRQRIQAEQIAAFQWKGNWGFLECDKQVAAIGMDATAASLGQTLSQIGPLHGYLTSRYQTRRQRTWDKTVKAQQEEEERARAYAEWVEQRSRGAQQAVQAQQARENSGGNRGGALGVSMPGNNARASASRGGARGGKQTLGQLGQLPPPIPARPPSGQAMANSSYRPAPQPGVGEFPLPDAPVPPLFLDSYTALTLQPQMMQGVGQSIYTTGVDPVKKYAFPQTTQQVYGWKARNSLEFFGVSRFGKRGMSMDDF